MSKLDVTRRGFLKGGALAAAAAGISAASLSGCAPTVASKSSGSGSSASTSAASDTIEVINPQDYDYRTNSGDTSALFSAWKLGPLSLSHRMVKSAAGSATYLAGYTDELYQYYVNFAKGGIEMIWVEGEAYQLPADGSDAPAEVVDFFTRLSEECATYGSHLGFQWAPFGLSAASLTVEQIKGIEAKGALLASHLKRMGFKAIEINSAGFNQGHQFLSRFYNTRTDEYGADTIENRVRFDVECIQAIHEACGDDFIVQILMECVEENDNLTNDATLMTLDSDVTKPHNLATTIPEAIAMAQAMEKGGANSFHLRLGPLGNHPCQFGSDLYFILKGLEGATGYGTMWNFSRHFGGKLIGNHSGAGMLIDITSMFKEKLSVPVGCVTYMDPAHAPDFFEAAIKDGKLDFYLMNRPFTVDFDYVNKMREGRIDEIAPCTRCLHCHAGSNQMNRMMSYCRVNALTQRVMTENGPATYELPPADSKKKVMIVGAGPAGMEAAHIAAQRGHSVTLFEKSGSVGGSLSFAHAVKGEHENLGDLISYLERQCELAGVTVKTKTEVSADTVKSEAPDVLVVATGGKREKLDVSGAKVVELEDFMLSDLGENVVVYGSGAQAWDAALWLTVHKKKVHIVAPEKDEEFDQQQSMHAKRFMTTALYALGVKAWPESTITSAADGVLTITSQALGGINVELECDSIVNAAIMQPNTELADAAGVAQTYTIGDAVAPFNIATAIRSGNDIGRAI